MSKTKEDVDEIKNSLKYNQLVSSKLDSWVKGPNGLFFDIKEGKYKI